MLRSLHTEAALAALAMHGVPADAEFAISYLLTTDFMWDGLPAVRVLQRFGRRLDVPLLLAVVERTDGPLGALAAATAIQLSKGVEGAARASSGSSKEELIRVALEAFRGESESALLEVAEPLLGHTRESIRLTAAAVLVEGLEHSALEAVMQRYRAAQTH